MTRACRLVYLLLLLAGVAAAQSTITLPYGKSITIEVTGATAAFAVDPQVAEASALAGVIVIKAIGPGTTSVIVVAPDGAHNVAVTVQQPIPLRPIETFSLGESALGESGSYEFRYTSDPGQITNSVAFSRNEGESFRRFRLVNATYLNSTGTGQVGFPLASYEIGDHNRDVIFLDAIVDNSPLTVDGALVRGLHWREGPWQFHGGYTSTASFQNYFITTDPQEVFGLSRTFQLNKSNALMLSAYQFFNPATLRSSSPDGAVGSLTYTFIPNRRFKLLSEVAVSRGVAFATRLRYDGVTQQLSAAFRYEPERFASLALGNPHGLFADVNYSRTFSERLSATFFLSDSKYNLPTIKQNLFATSGNAVFRLNRFFSVTGGSSYSHFTSTLPVSPSLSSLSVPVGLQFTSRHFSAGAQYQPTTDFTGPLGNGYGFNVGGNAAAFHFGAYYRHDVQVLSSSALLSSLPGLTDLLGRSVAETLTVEQLIALLSDVNILKALGLTNGIAINLTPARDDVGANLSWSTVGLHAQRVEASFLDSRSQLATTNFSFRTVTARYTRQLDRNNEIAASFSIFQTNFGAASTTQPVFELSFRHRFLSAPSWLIPGKHGEINGHVFRDDRTEARYTGKQPGLAGLEVVLDDARSTRTDANGYYRFAYVPFGPHRVEAHLSKSEPYFFTTDSPASAEIGSTVDIGVNFLRGQIHGVLHNDGGTGVGGVMMELRGPNVARVVQTDDGGSFNFTGLEAGAYTLATRADSYPTGYDLQSLPVAQVQVETGLPAAADLTIRALRSISGKANFYDPQQLTLLPLAGVVVRLVELKLETKTDADGRFAFRNLPAGSFSLVATHGGTERTHTVTLPAQPENVTDVTFIFPAPQP